MLVKNSFQPPQLVPDQLLKAVLIKVLVEKKEHVESRPDISTLLVASVSTNGLMPVKSKLVGKRPLVAVLELRPAFQDSLTILRLVLVMLNLTVSLLLLPKLLVAAMELEQQHHDHLRKLLILKIYTSFVKAILFIFSLFLDFYSRL
jgi:hypothetical protein